MSDFNALLRPELDAAFDKAREHGFLRGLRLAAAIAHNRGSDQVALDLSKIIVSGETMRLANSDILGASRDAVA